MAVSENRCTPKSSILIGFSIINHPFWGTTIYGNTHIYQSPTDYSLLVLEAFPVASTSPWRRILTAVNVARDPVPAIQVPEKNHETGRSWDWQMGRQIYYSWWHPDPGGNHPIWRTSFSNGLKPPTTELQKLILCRRLILCVSIFIVVCGIVNALFYTFVFVYSICTQICWFVYLFCGSEYQVHIKLTFLELIAHVKK